MRRTRRAAVALAIGCSILVMGISGIAMYLKTDHARRQFTGYINRILAGKVVLDGHVFSLCNGRLELRGLRVEGPSGEPVAGCDRLFVDFAWLSLFRGNLRLHSVVLERPLDTPLEDRIRRHQPHGGIGDKGKWVPLRKTGRENTLPALSRVILEAFSLVDGTVRFEDAAANWHISELRAVNLEAEADFSKPAVRMQLEIRGVDLSLPGHAMDWNSCRLEAAFRAGRLDISSAEITGPAGSISLNGRVAGLPNAPALDLAVEAGLSIPELGRTFGIVSALTGRLTSRLFLKGSWNNPAADLSVDVAGGRLAGVPVERLQARFALRDRQVTVASLSSGAFGGDLNVSGTVDMRPAFPDGRMDGGFQPDALAYDLQLKAHRTSSGPAPAGNPEMDRYGGWIRGGGGDRRFP